MKAGTTYRPSFFTAVAGLCLLLPGLLTYIGFPGSEPLKGAYTPASKPQWTVHSWFSADFQKQTDEYLQSELTLRPILVRCRNQFLYSVLNRPAPRFVVKGKNEYLYEDAYIKAHYGMDFRGEEVWDSITGNLDLIAQKLKSDQIPLILVLAPGKASFFPEYIPDRYLPFRKPNTNYDALSGKLAQSQVHLIDLHAWFRELKKKEAEQARFPLFPKTGTHWSTYGMHLAADSIRNYVQQFISTPIPEWNYTTTDLSANLKDQDRDIEESLNLMYPIANFPMQYPELTLNDSGKYKPKGAIIADSYFWNMFDKGFCSRFMENGEFWYYGQQVYPQSFDGPYPLTVDHIKQSISGYDFLIFLSTDGTLDRFPWGADTLLLDALSD